MISFSQIKQIHALKAILGLNDEIYKEILMSFGVTSCKDLTFTEAKILLEILSEKAIAAGKWQKPDSKFSELEKRSNSMASPAQLRKIEAMWRDLCFEKTYKEAKKTLRKFIQNHFKVSDIRFIDKATASKIIHVIDKIQSEKISHYLHPKPVKNKKSYYREAIFHENKFSKKEGKKVLNAY